MFRILVIGLFLVATSVGSALADEYVHGYVRQDGTYVAPYYRSSPNGTVMDNYSFHGNMNPYTGKVGMDNYTHDATSPYFEGPDATGRVGHDGFGQ